MKQYLYSFLTFKKYLYSRVSFFALWDKKTRFTKYSEIRRFAKLKNCNIGKYSRVNPNCKLSNTTVGKFSAIGHSSEIGLGRHPLNYVSSQNIFYKNNNLNNRWVKSIDFPILPIKIGNDVWIGIHSLIMDGVSIGDGAVVGACSVVTKDVPPYAIVVGSPSRIIKYRFEKAVIDRLLEIEWWNFSDDEISGCIDFFREPEINLEILNKYFPKH
ncbi:MAG: CatB-related O-acetyltransferase [Prolixibacteraceae bacterium]|nr:CatB-related O-acetyltransferase [Prolixibacteraceae bacterium]